MSNDLAPPLPAPSDDAANAFDRAERVSRSAAAVGFDWETPAQVLDKIDEERREVQEALDRGDRAAAAREVGDLAFALVNLARHVGVSLAETLDGTTDRFERRFAHVCARLHAEGRAPSDVSLDALEALWQEAKTLE